MNPAEAVLKPIFDDRSKRRRVTGPIEFLRTIRVDIQGRGTLETAPALGPAATLTLDWETYVRLACGRVTPEAVADRVKTEGDPALTTAILRHFAITK